MIVKYAILTIIGDKKQTKTEQKYFFEKDSFLCYVRKNQSIILEFRLWSDDNEIKISCRKELEDSLWKVYHPKKKPKEKKPKERKEQKEMIETVAINSMIAEKQLVVIYLMNGYQIKTKIVNQDDTTILVAADGKTRLIYKHAISTIEF